MPTTRGERGRRGATGRQGPAGPATTRSQILEAVQNEFNELAKQLRVQLERTAQMQAQLDAIHGLLKQLLAKT